MALELSHQEVASAKPNHNANASKIRISHQHLVRLHSLNYANVFFYLSVYPLSSQTIPNVHSLYLNKVQ